jgi:putative DNA primase/helicase
MWTGEIWKTDGGALIHSKGLEMVRNIYDELLKTADFKERIEIERYATLCESVRHREAFLIFV